MRIIAGAAKGRPLSAVASATRPTSDRAREALFSTLASEFGEFDGLRVLDLYAGTGAIALEALSRGAAIVHAVEKDEAAAKIPSEWLLNSHLVGPKNFVKERLAAFKEAGVTVISVNPIGPNAVQQVELLRSLIDDVR